MEKLARRTKNRLLNLTKSQGFIMCVYVLFYFAHEYFKVVAQYLGIDNEMYNSVVRTMLPYSCFQRVANTFYND